MARAHAGARAAVAFAVSATTACSLLTSTTGLTGGNPDATTEVPGLDAAAPDATDALVTGSSDAPAESTLAEDGAGPQPDAGSDSGDAGDGGPVKIVFVTSTTYLGSLGGPAGADAKCQTQAQAAGLTGTFRAWISDSATTTAGARLSHAVIPYARVDGRVVATSWTGLSSGTLLRPIDVTEDGGVAPGTDAGCTPKPVWTNTASDGGRQSGIDCYDWSDGTTTPGGGAGNALATGPSWSFTCEQTCSIPAAIYCLEQ